MDNYTYKILATLVVGLLGSILTFIRRWKNDESAAGAGVSGWTIVVIIFILFS